MKKLIWSILAFGIVAQGCENALQEDPKTFISPDNYFSQPGAYESAVKGIYVNLRGFYGGRAMMMREMFSDIYDAPSASYEQALPTYRNAHEPFFYTTRDQWSTAYSIIKNANFILSRLSGAELPAAEKNALTAEARFLRAFSYFQLVQFYGDVPLRIKPVENYQEIQLPRSPQDEVYGLITEDLLYAEANLPEEAPQQGRAYRLAATALLAKVYLTMAGYPLNRTALYEQARNKALAVIDSEEFQLEEDYPEAFHNTEYSSESIWELLFEPSTGGNGLHALSSTAVSYTPILLPAPWFMNSFPEGDRRRSWGIREHYVAPGGNELAPFFQKFVNNTFIDQGTGPSGSGLLNYTIPLLRLGEMYLIAAEAENEMNGPGDAYRYINEVRRRARVDKGNPAHVPDLAGLTREQFREAVLMERKWELHLEGSTWFDLKRTARLGRIQEIRGDNLIRPIGDYNNTWYIPDTEITNNNIPQNPSY